MRKIRYLSLFSGIEAASLAFEPLGWEPVAFCEVDEFASSILANRWPDVPNLGSICDVDWSEYHGAADVCIGGFPCQSYSIAGLRKGLADPRGELMLEFLRACREVDPEWVIAENVPGLLSSHQGRDFQTFLDAVAILWPRGGCCWRVLDAQWFGLAQRRRRLFVVVNTRDWRRAAAVLSEPEGVLWDLAPQQEKRKALAAGPAGDAGEGGGGGVTSFKWWQGANARSVAAYDDGTTSTLTNSDSHQAAVMYPSDKMLFMASGQAHAEIGEDVSQTMSARQFKDPPIVIDRAAYNQGANAQYPPT